METGPPLALLCHVEGQMTQILSGIGSTSSLDLTQNNVPNDSVQILEKSQGPQTCTGPQEREESRFQVRLPQHSPARSHTSMALHAGTAAPCHLPG